MKKKNGFLPFDTLAPWLIGLAVLVIVIIFYIVLQGKGTSALNFLKNLFKFQ